MSTATSPFHPISNLSFQLKGSPHSKFSPRIGKLCLTRPDHGTGTVATDSHDINIELPTPGLIASTTRGAIQHLTRDNVRRTPCVKWIHVPFESLCVYFQQNCHHNNMYRFVTVFAAYRSTPPSQHCRNLAFLSTHFWDFLLLSICYRCLFEIRLMGVKCLLTESYL